MSGGEIYLGTHTHTFPPGRICPNLEVVHGSPALDLSAAADLFQLVISFGEAKPKLFCRGGKVSDFYTLLSFRVACFWIFSF